MHSAESWQELRCIGDDDAVRSPEHGSVSFGESVGYGRDEVEARGWICDSCGRNSGVLARYYARDSSVIRPRISKADADGNR